jgi:hypothetical protein
MASLGQLLAQLASRWDALAQERYGTPDSGIGDVLIRKVQADMFSACAQELRDQLMAAQPSATEVVRLALAQAANHAMTTSNRLADEGGAAKNVAAVAEQAVGNALLNAAAAIGWAVQEGTVPDPLSPPRGVT